MPKKASLPIKQRDPLTKQRVLRCAISLADEHGVDALSMRRLASSLGVEAMSLYNHVANKDALLDGLVELVSGEIYVPNGQEDWKSAMRSRAFSAREVLLRHPWALALIESRKSLDTARLGACDAVLGTLRGAGFPIELAYHAFVTLDSYIYGFALQEQSWPAESTQVAVEIERVRPQISENRYPHITEVMGFITNARRTTTADSAQQGATSAYQAEFAFGLELLLDALERALKKEPGRRNSPQR